VRPFLLHERPGVIMPTHYTTLQQIENVLAAVALSLVWLMPNHQLPWSAMHHELTMAVMLGLMSVVLAWQTRWRLPVPAFALVLLMLAWVPWGQWLAGLLPKSGTAAVSSALVGAMALAFLLGHAARVNQHRRLLDVVFAALALASAANVPVQWIQWLQWYSSDLDSLVLLLVTPLNERARPSGMILQPNQLATIHVWGLIGLSWFRMHRKLSTAVFVLLFAWIGVGIGLTQSRTGLLEMAVVALLLSLAVKGEPRRTLLAVWWVALLWLVTWSLAFKDVAVWLGVRQDAEARLTALDGARIDAWRAFGAAILQRPWFGHGLTDVGFAYVALADSRPELYIGQRFGHAHNIVLDVLLWVGIPLGLLLLGALAIWGIRRLAELPRQTENALPLTALAALGVHAMLELPHYFLYFMAPAALLAGWLTPVPAHRPGPSLPRPTWAVAGLATLGMVGWISADYFPYQERYTEWRFENNRVGKRPDIEVHSPLILNQIHDELALYRLPLRANMSADELRWIDDTARSVYSPPAYYAAAKAHALAGDEAAARVWMMRYNATMGMDGTRAAQSIWARDQGNYSGLVRVKWPDYAGRNTAFRLAPEEAERMAPLPLPSPVSEPASNTPE